MYLDDLEEILKDLFEQNPFSIIFDYIVNKDFKKLSIYYDYFYEVVTSKLTALDMDDITDDIKEMILDEMQELSK